jgi:hypothetical protein
MKAMVLLMAAAALAGARELISRWLGAQGMICDWCARWNRTQDHSRTPDRPWQARPQHMVVPKRADFDRRR